MTNTFNSGTLTVTQDTISYRKWFKTTSLQRNKISHMTYKYDSKLSRILSVPVGLFYLITIVGIPIGFRCLRGDRSVIIRTTNHEEHSFWVNGNDIRGFKNSLQY